MDYNSNKEKASISGAKKIVLKKDIGVAQFTWNACFTETLLYTILDFVSNGNFFEQPNKSTFYSKVLNENNILKDANITVTNCINRMRYLKSQFDEIQRAEKATGGGTIINEIQKLKHEKKKKQIFYDCLEEIYLNRNTSNYTTLSSSNVSTVISNLDHNYANVLLETTADATNTLITDECTDTVENPNINVEENVVEDVTENPPIPITPVPKKRKTFPATTPKDNEVAQRFGQQTKKKKGNLIESLSVINEIVKTRNEVEMKRLELENRKLILMEQQFKLQKFDTFHRIINEKQQHEDQTPTVYDLENTFQLFSNTLYPTATFNSTEDNNITEDNNGEITPIQVSDNEDDNSVVQEEDQDNVGDDLDRLVQSINNNDFNY